MLLRCHNHDTTLWISPGHDIASISESSAARLLVNVSNIKVSGDLSIQAGDDRYLELTWTYPEASQAGDFHCEANAVNDLGHNVVFSTSLSVPAKHPSLADLAKILHDIKVFSTTIWYNHFIINTFSRCQACIVQNVFKQKLISTRSLLLRFQ